MNTDGNEKGERKDMLKGECWINARIERKETRDNDGISMVLGEGQKPTGERSELYFTSTRSTKQTKDRPTITLIFASIISFMSFTVLLSLM